MHPRLHISPSKRALAALAGWLAVVPRARRRLFANASAPRRVLLLEPFGLGDVLSHQPLTRALLAAGFQVGFCARAPFRELLPPDVHWINSKLPWGLHDFAQKYHASAYRSPEFKHCLRDLRGFARGAIGVDTRGDIRGVWLLHLVGCARVLTLDHYLDSNLALPAMAAERIPFDFSLRRWELNLRFLPLLGVPPATTAPPNLAAQPSPLAPPAVRPIALIPVAPWEGKFWPTENWRSLVAELRRAGHAVCGLCGPGQTTAAQAQLGTEAPIHEQNSIGQWLSALAATRAVVSVDTGPMHLADALGMPLVALYGAGRLPLWLPSSPSSRALHHQNDPDYQPLHATPANAAAARSFLARITVRNVLETLEALNIGVRR